MRKYGNAIRSKPIILKAITDINAETLNFKTKLILTSLTYKNVSLKEVILKVCESRVLPIKNYHKRMV
jgi:type III secretory pathway component EscS